MTLYSILSTLFRLFGFARMAESFWEKHEAKLKQQGKPLTNAEENADIANLPDK